MKRIIEDRDYKMLKKIASNYEVDQNLIKEIMEENIDKLPNSAFLVPEARAYPVASPAQAYTSYLYASYNNDTENANKLACILEDVYNITPPKRIEKAKNSQTIKVASEYVKFLNRDDKYRVKLANMPEGNVSGKVANEILNLRCTFYAMNHPNPDQNIIAAYQKVANIIDEYDKFDKPMTKKELAKIASVIEEIDKSIGMERYYDKYVMDPIDTVASFVTDKPRTTIKIGSDSYNVKTLTGIPKVAFEGILDNDTIDKLYDKNGLKINALQTLYKTADDNTKIKIKKILTLLAK